jgi:hypothetical protein
MNIDTGIDELMRIKQRLYVPNKLKLDKIESEREHADYGAHTFTLNQHPVKFRIAKITPIKIGCFVALWQRHTDGSTIPYAIDDPFSFYIIHVINEKHCGQFIFPKDALVKNNILSNNGKGGKRGFRLYPAWDTPESKQAIKTQAWQLPYFVEIKKQQTVLPVELLQAIQ